MYFVYAIKSDAKNFLYVGLTSNIEERLKRHNSGTVRSTQPYRPYTLVHVEIADNRNNARTLEKYLKSGYGKEFLKEIAAVVEWQTRRT